MRTEKNMPAMHFLFWLFGLTGLMFMGSASLNFYMDPLAHIRSSTLIYYSAERELKPKLLNSSSFDGILLGNSKITYIQTDDLTRYGRFLNAGFSAATIEEIRYFLEDLKPKTRFLTLGLDYIMFRQSPGFTERDQVDFGPASPIELFKYLTSLDTFLYSIKSTVRHLRDKPLRYTALGARNRKHLEAADRKNQADYHNALNKIRLSPRFDFSYSERRMEELGKIKLWAKQRNIRIIAYINPYDAGVFQIASNKMRDNIKRITTNIRAIFPDLIDLSQTYPETTYYWKKDPVHFYPSTGNLIFTDHLWPELQSAMAKTGNTKTH